ncbi:MAG TPA: hypothetical protein DDZ80_27305 [Cyanobacteria bacterium UBA8803]|nr:hypothetical protein [Cyanobacteria bacterium UBA9273]HBL61981.1 hypothetical protein [Cyanobacteria bacterium UBA8803]
MTQDKPDKPQAKERRQRINQTAKSVNVRLTYQEWKFLRDASTQLNKTISVLLRDGAREKIERESDLRLDNYDDTEHPP